MKTYGQ